MLGEIFQFNSSLFQSIPPNSSMSRGFIKLAKISKYFMPAKGPSLNSLITLLKRWWTSTASWGDIVAEKARGTDERRR